MSVSIPLAGGVPGISGPPDWLDPPPAGSPRLDDVRWRGATARTFGGGSSASAVFRATQAPVGGQQYIFLSFRAAFVESLNTAYDYVYLGLQKQGGTQAMVVQIQAHSATFTSVGYPAAPPPGNVQSVQIYLWNGAQWQGPQAMTPAWINANARMWLQNNTDFAPDDPNYRWAVQLRIPVTSAPDITNGTGPDLGTDFLMWYLIQGSLSTNDLVILGEDRAAGTTTKGNLILQQYPAPTAWDEFLLTSGPAAFGGIALSWGDVVVQNSAYGEGWTIANGQSNTFVARPRNYRPSPGNTIPAGGINATFRIANWGSLPGDPSQPNFATGTWDYVPGQQAPNGAVTPVNSNTAVPELPAGSNPPTTTSPISLTATMNLAAGKSLHQCVLVTLAGTNLTFLNDSIFQNMNYDHASLLEREAEISVIGLTPFSPQPRDVYLAIEKVNMRRDTPGANEGQLLAASMQRLIDRGGPLADKLKQAQAELSAGGGEDGNQDFGSAARLDSILSALAESLADVHYAQEDGRAALERALAATRAWLEAVKAEEGAGPQRLAVVLDALAAWLSASGAAALAKLTTFVTQLGSWLGTLPTSDPASAQLGPGAVNAWLAWLSALAGGEQVAGQVATIQGWVAAGRPDAQVGAVIAALGQLLVTLSRENPQLAGIFATFASAAAAWLRGDERLQALVSALNNAGLTDEELDQLFPTFRVHPYYDSGERFVGSDGRQHRVLQAQSSFGIYAYHEGAVDGWQTSIQGARRIAPNLYLLSVPNNGTARITTRIQAVGPGEQRLPEDPIQPTEPGPPAQGCLGQLIALVKWLLGKLGL